MNACFIQIGIGVIHVELGRFLAGWKFFIRPSGSSYHTFFFEQLHIGQLGFVRVAAKVDVIPMTHRTVNVPFGQQQLQKQYRRSTNRTPSAVLSKNSMSLSHTRLFPFLPPSTRHWRFCSRRVRSCSNLRRSSLSRLRSIFNCFFCA